MMTNRVNNNKGRKEKAMTRRTKKKNYVSEPCYILTALRLKTEERY